MAISAALNQAISFTKLGPEPDNFGNVHNQSKQEHRYRIERRRLSRPTLGPANLS